MENKQTTGESQAESVGATETQKQEEEMTQVKLKFGLVEDKGDEVFLNLGEADSFEEIVAMRKTKSIFRDVNKLIIIQRIEVAN